MRAAGTFGAKWQDFSTRIVTLFVGSARLLRASICWQSI
jgi:hypothetical protein